MRSPSLEAWRMLCAVAEHGGFHAASTQLHKTPSAIHHGLRKLESELELSLVQVEGKRVSLTEAGLTLGRRAQYLLDESQRILGVAQALGQQSQSVRLAIDQAYPLATVLPALEALLQEHPYCQLELREPVLGGAAEMLRANQADLAITPIPLSDCLNEYLGSQTFICVAAPDHPLHRSNRLLQVEDLKAHRQIVLRDSASTRQHDAGWLGSEQRWTVDHLQTSIQIVQRGLGFAWLPQAQIQDALDAHRLQPLNVTQGQSRAESFYLSSRDRDALGALTLQLCAALRNQSAHTV